MIWWAHGGKLRGDSAARFRFLRSFLEDVPGLGLKLWNARDDYRIQWDDVIAIPEDPAFFGQYFFFYFSL